MLSIFSYTCHLYIFFSEAAAQAFCPVFKCTAGFLSVYLLEFFEYFQYKSFIMYVILKYLILVHVFSFLPVSFTEFLIFKDTSLILFFIDNAFAVLSKLHHETFYHTFSHIFSSRSFIFVHLTCRFLIHF